MSTTTPGGTVSPSRRIDLADAWGGLGAMLVALPSAIAFGVAMYAPLGPGFAGAGALAGGLGTVAIGLPAPAPRFDGAEPPTPTVPPLTALGEAAWSKRRGDP